MFERILLWLLVMMAAGLVGVTLYEEVLTEVRCVASSPVEEITKVHYRTAWIILENGKELTINQGTAEVGQPFCYEYERVVTK